MSETTIQAGMQTIFQSMAEFASADVVINDWGVLDEAITGAPYLIIENTDVFVSTQESPTGNAEWSIPVILFEAFDTWPTTLNNLRNRRDAIIVKFNEVGTARAAGGIEAVNIHTITADGPPDYLYDNYNQEINEAEPAFVFQRLLFLVNEGWG